MSGIEKGLLDPEIQFDNASLDVISTKVENVLVTGATGFVGAFMVHNLLKRGITAHCIVRANSADQAQARMEQTLKQYQLWHPGHSQYLKPITGDLSLPLLGLSKPTFHALSNTLDSIFHAGALVDWMLPLSTYIPPNILSTHEILRLAAHNRPKSIHFISTISTLPLHAGYSLSPHTSLEHGYATSKYLAERLLVAARFRGARAYTYRLPLISAATTNGQFRRDRGDFLHNFVAGCLELGAFPHLEADLSSVLPVDYLVGTIACVMTGTAAATDEGADDDDDDDDDAHDAHSAHRYEPADYDFVHPGAPHATQFFEALATAGGLAQTRPIPFGAWQARATEYAGAHPGCALARIATILDGYETGNAGGLLKGCGVVGRNVFGKGRFPVPGLGERYVRRYVGCIRGEGGDGARGCENA